MSYYTPTTYWLRDLKAFTDTTLADLQEVLRSTWVSEGAPISFTGSALIDPNAADLDLLVYAEKIHPSDDWLWCGYEEYAMEDGGHDKYTILRRGIWNLICAHDQEVYYRWLRATRVMVDLHGNGITLNKEQRALLFDRITREYR